MHSPDARTQLRLRRRPLLAIALAAFLVLPAGVQTVLAHEGHDGPETGPNDPNAPRRLSEAAIKNGGITLADVAPRAVERVIRVPGRIVPRPETIYDLHAPIEGLILKVSVVPGQGLKAGEEVARIGGAPLAALVGEWDRLRREAKGAAGARTLLGSLVEREISIALEGRRLDLLVAASEHRAAAAELDAALRAGESLPERERRTRAAAEAQARVRLEEKRGRLRAAGLTPDEVKRLEDAPSERTAPETLALDSQAMSRRFTVLAEHAGDSLERAKEAASAEAALQAVTLRIRLTGLAMEDLEALSTGATEASVPLRTPIAGVVRTLSVHAGHWIEAGGEVAHLIDPTSVQVEADVPESDFGRVQVGAVARVRRGGRSDLALTGKVRWIAPAVDPQTRRLRVVIDLDAVPAVPVDLGVDVAVVTERFEEAKAVPVSAVLAEGAERYVYKLKDGAFVRTPVVVGASDDRFVQVLDGLYSGEKVVATGAELVRDTPPAQAAPAAPKPAETKSHP